MENKTIEQQRGEVLYASDCSESDFLFRLKVAEALFPTPTQSPCLYPNYERDKIIFELWCSGASSWKAIQNYLRRGKHGLAEGTFLSIGGIRAAAQRFAESTGQALPRGMRGRPGKKPVAW